MTTHESRLKITLLDEVSSRARGISSALMGIERQAAAFTAPFRSMTGQLLAFGGAYVGISEGYRATAGAAMEFENAFADVRKVVEASEEQFENMRRTIRQMSTELPIAATDIAALFAAAGESGVATQDLKAFSEMAARVGIAFDMSAGEAGESLAKLKTQLGLSVAETGDMADAINHLSNNMASKAKDITAYMLRVGALAEMGGFTKEEIAGIGSAMIAAGAEAEVAGTAMQNVVKALTRGGSAKKSQQDVAAALGLDLPEIAKEMQKDAPKAMKKVLQAIGKAPKDRHIALLSDFFGDEAKAFAPLIGNMGLLETALDSVGDKAKYSGSALKEYVERSSTASSEIQLLNNKISDRFWKMGDGMLPAIKEGVASINYALDTLDSRVSVFDELTASVQGFMNGLGYSGVQMKDIGDLLFGKIDPTAGDQIGRIFLQAKDWGASIRELNDAIASNPIAQFMADIAPYGLQIAAWGVGIGLLAGSIRSLGSALMFLSGASTLLAALKAVGTIADLFPRRKATPSGTPSAAPSGPPGRGKRIPGARPGTKGPWGTVPKSTTLPPGTKLTPTGPRISGPAAAPSPVPGFSWKGLAGGVAGGLITTLATELGERAIRGGFKGIYGDKYVEPPGLLDSMTGTLDAWRDLFSDIGKAMPAASEVYSLQALDAARNARAAGIGGNSTDTLPGKTADDLGMNRPYRLDAASIDALTQPRGTQDVNVLNPRPAPNFTIQLGGVHVHGVTDPDAIADQVAPVLAQRLRDEVAGIYANTGYGVA